MIYGIRFRHIEGLVILQVLEKTTNKYDAYKTEDVWRDGQPEDLLEVAMYCKPYAAVLDTRLDCIEGRLSSYENRGEDRYVK